MPTDRPKWRLAGGASLSGMLSEFFKAISSRKAVHDDDLVAFISFFTEGSYMTPAYVHYAYRRV
jgi:hypothetical protein